MRQKKTVTQSLHIPNPGQLVQQPTHDASGTTTNEQLMFEVAEPIPESLEVDETVGESIEGLFEESGTDGEENSWVGVAQQVIWDSRGTVQGFDP